LTSNAVLGAPFNFAPRNKISITGNYQLPLSPDVGKVSVGAVYTYTGTQFVAPGYSVGAVLPDFQVVDLHANWEGIFGNPIDAEFFVTNLFNEYYQTYVTGGSLYAGLGYAAADFGPPRMFGGRLRYHFAIPKAPTAPANPAIEAPPPPPPPAPVAAAPEAQRQFQVFFDFDKSDITAAAADVITAAANTVKSGHIATVNVTGHTDTVGTVKYNQALSERRAAAVKAALIADGVSADEITAAGVGKTDLLVPTKDGVREPQNRRAVILMQQATS
jgi:outer membrane protein OmpA-like peptidoglycan-associated protein